VLGRFAVCSGGFGALDRKIELAQRPAFFALQ
jgi:hypothetical protein